MGVFYPLATPGVVSKTHNRDLSDVLTAGPYFLDHFKDGDTMILITLSPGYNKLRTCQSLYFPEKQQLRFDSGLLRDSGLEKIGKLLDDERYQKRLMARLKRNGEVLPDGIRFVLDLGPSTDETSRTEHLEALSLPKGIVRWGLMVPESLKIPFNLAGGHDDYCNCFYVEKHAAATTPTSSTPASPALASPAPASPAPASPAPTNPGGGPGLWEAPLQPDYRNIADYCEVRHAANVTRLLLGMIGKPLLLDSAARVYTIAGLAKIFDINLSSKFADSLVR